MSKQDMYYRVKYESMTEKEFVTILEYVEHQNMQYYMEYCEANGYVTPSDWITNHKHF